LPVQSGGFHKVFFGVAAFSKNLLSGTLEIPPAVTEIGAMAFSGYPVRRRCFALP
jgi:hypothetical protein